MQYADSAASDQLVPDPNYYVRTFNICQLNCKVEMY